MADPDFQSKQDRHARFVAAISDALVLNRWDGLDAVAAVRLSEEERAVFAATMLSVMHHDNVKALCEVICAGWTPFKAKFQSHEELAKDWARVASVNELKAFVSVGIKAMDKDTRAAMIKWAGGL